MFHLTTQRLVSALGSAALAAPLAAASVPVAAATPAAPSGAAVTSTTVSGTLERIISDDLHHGHSAQVTRVRTGSRTVSVAAAKVAGIPTGARIKVQTTSRTTGGKRQSSVKVTRLGGSRISALSSPLTQHNLVVVPIYWATAGVPAGQPDSAAFSATAARVNDFYAATTGGRAGFTLEKVLPWTKINLSTAAACSTITSTVEQAVRTQVNNQLGATAGDRHIMAYFPQASACGWAGLAYVGGDFSWINGYNQTNVWAHELGHNLGLSHSGAATCWADSARTQRVPLSSNCVYDEYGDRFDIMGNAATLSHLSSQREVNLGVLTPSDVVTRTVSDTVRLAPVESSAGVRQIRIPAGTKTYLIEYRTPTGLDAWLGADSGTSPEGVTYPSPGTGVVVRVVSSTDAGTPLKQSILNFASLHPGRPGVWGMQQGEAWAAPDRTLGLRVVAADADGATVSVDPAPDVTPPTAFSLTSPVAGQYIKGQDVKVAWTPTTDSGSGLKTIEVEVDGKVLSTLTAGTDDLTAPQTYTLPIGAHRVRAIAKDVMGNARATTIQSFTLSDDATGPVVRALTSPLAGSVVRNPASITWGAGGMVDAGTGLASYEVISNGTMVRKVTTSNAGAGLSLALPVGTQSLQIRATDRVGNVTLTDPVTLRVSGDMTPPTFTASMPALSATGQATVSWASLVDAGEGLDSFELWVDGKLDQRWGAVDVPTSKALTLVAGRHAVMLKATDRVGNARTATGSVLVDTTAPVVSSPVAQLLPGAVTSSGVPVGMNWAVTETGSGVLSQTLTRDGAPVPGVSAGSRSLTTNATAGTSSFSVTAQDRVGYSGSAQTNVAVQIDAVDGVLNTVACATCLGGSEAVTWAPGESVTRTVTGSSIGVVALTAPDRGAVAVWVDGVLRGQFNEYSYARGTIPRQLWTLKVPAGTHTVKLVNLGTATRPVMGVDAVVGLG